eukprot:gene12732-14037_t
MRRAQLRIFEGNMEINVLNVNYVGVTCVGRFDIDKSLLLWKFTERRNVGLNNSLFQQDIGRNGKHTLGAQVTFEEKKEFPKVPIPFRLRIGDAYKEENLDQHENLKFNELYAMQPGNNIPEETWGRFLNEFIDVADEDIPNLCPICKEKEGMLANFKSNRMVWIPALDTYLSSVKALVFEKYWKKIFLDKRTFTRDPAPHIASCCHCKTVLSVEDSFKFIAKKAEEARRKARVIREEYKERENKDILEATKRLEKFKRKIRENAEKLRNEATENLKIIKTVSEERKQLVKDEKTKAKEKEAIKKLAAKQPRKQFQRTKATKSPSLPKLKQRSVSPIVIRRRSINMFLIQDIPETDSSSVSDYDPSSHEVVIDAALQKLEEEDSRESSPELLPVVMPDWVKDFFDRKKDAKEELEVAQSAAIHETKSPVAIFVGDEEEDPGHAIIEEEFDVSSNSVGRQLDFTGNLMSKIAPIPMGMESKEIADACITASSQQDAFHKPIQARLNNEHRGKNAGAWCPKKHDNNQWLQIDLGKVRNIQQISTQGMPLSSVKRPKDKRWVESFSISVSDDGEQWSYYSEDDNSNSKVFIGNTDLTNISVCSLVDGMKTRFIRIHPISWNNGIALRVEIYGEQEEEKVDNHLIPADGTAFQRYALNSDDETVDFNSVQADNKDYNNNDINNNYSETTGDQHDHNEPDYDDGSPSEHVPIDDFSGFDSAEAKVEEMINAHLISEATAILEQASEKQASENQVSNKCESIAKDVQINIEEASVGSSSGNAEQLEEAANSARLEREREEELHKEAEEKKRLLNEEAKRKYKEEVERQERANKRKLFFHNAVQKLTRKGSISTGIIPSEVEVEEEEDDDFLSMYCILTDKQKSLYSRVFEQFDKTNSGYIDASVVTNALRVLNLRVLKDPEMLYIRKVINAFDPLAEDGVIDQKTFNIIAAFSQRLKQMDSVSRGHIRETNFDMLYLNAHKTRDLFEQLLEENERSVSLEQFLIELEAGGVEDEKRKMLSSNLKDLSHDNEIKTDPLNIDVMWI